MFRIKIRFVKLLTKHVCILHALVYILTLINLIVRLCIHVPVSEFYVKYLFTLSTFVIFSQFVSLSYYLVTKQRLNNSNTKSELEEDVVKATLSMISLTSICAVIYSLIIDKLNCGLQLGLVGLLDNRISIFYHIYVLSIYVLTVYKLLYTSKVYVLFNDFIDTSDEFKTSEKSIKSSIPSIPITNSINTKQQKLSNRVNIALNNLLNYFKPYSTICENLTKTKTLYNEISNPKYSNSLEYLYNKPYKLILEVSTILSTIYYKNNKLDDECQLAINDALNSLNKFLECNLDEMQKIHSDTSSEDSIYTKEMIHRLQTLFKDNI